MLHNRLREGDYRGKEGNCQSDTLSRVYYSGTLHRPHFKWGRLLPLASAALTIFLFSNFIVRNVPVFGVVVKQKHYLTFKQRITRQCGEKPNVEKLI